MIKLIIILLIGINLYGGIPILFEHPRDGKFKWATNEQFNSSTMIHGMGSFMGTIITATLYKKFDVTSKPALWGMATVWGLGLLKETEDGFREGFGRTDLLSNTIGCGIGFGLFYILNYYHTEKINFKVTNNNIYLTVAL